MTLAALKLGVEARVTALDGLPETEQLRLSALGLAPGALVTKLMPTPLRDPVECLVDGQLLALTNDLMARVFVEPR